MEFLLLLLLVVVLILVLSIKNNTTHELQSLDRKLNELQRLLSEVRLEQKKTDKPALTREPTQPAAASPIRDEKKEPEEVVRKETVPTVPQPPKEVIREQPAPALAPQSAEGVTRANTRQPVARQVKPGFFERNPDLEKFIGENLANKIGIAVLVVGIGFFVKFAIDQEWINEIGRVFIGILSGGILLALAHRLRKTFTAFSSVLVGGGIAVLYFTIAIAFHEYRIFSQTAAFALMVIITGFTILLSLGYNRIELAVLAILGGFGAPFMVSTGDGNYIVLFAYMLILNAGMLVLAYFKKWRIVNIVCYVFTIIIFGAWVSTRFPTDNTSMIIGGLVFATIFYLVFFVMNIINNLKLKTAFEATEIIMLLSNTFLYFSAGMFILNNNTGEDFKGLFTAVLAVFNFAFAYTLYKNDRADRKLVFMLIGLVLTFISLAAPIQLEGNYITLFWAAETVILLWLWQKSGIKLMSIASVIVMALMVISLALDWKNIYGQLDYSRHLTIFLNKGYVTGIVALASVVLTWRLLRSEKEGAFLAGAEYKTAITIGFCAILYLVNLLELRYQIIYYVDSVATQTVIIGSYNMLFIASLLLASKKLTLNAQLKDAMPLFGLFAMGAYLFYYHGAVVTARNEYLETTSGIAGFLFHYPLVGLLIVSICFSLQVINANRQFVETIKSAHWWIFIFLFVFLASAELDHTVLLMAYTSSESAGDVISQNHKIGYPILWGVASFLLIAIGLNKRIKMLRIISLVLLLITFLKLFLIDLRDISEGGKIAAFISLGILLLVVSFLYQRLKKLLLDDNQPSE